MPSIKGTASVADARARSKALKTTRFPANFAKKIKLDKVNKPVLTQWIEQKVTSILGFDDEIVSSTAINLFLPGDGSTPDPRRAQLDLVGFLGEEESATFAKDLWTLLVEAQDSPSGIPRTLLEAKKKEMSQQVPVGQQGCAYGPNNNGAAGGMIDNPEMNRFVQEANRRAAAVRQLVPDAADNGNAANAEDSGPVPVPVSPPHPREHVRDDHRLNRQNRNGRGGSHESDRKMPAHRSSNSRSRSDRHPRNAARPPPPPCRDDGLLPPPRAGYRRPTDDGGRGIRRSSQERNSSVEHGIPINQYGPAEDEFHRTNNWRRDEGPPYPPVPPPHNDEPRRRGGSASRSQRRYHSEEDEMDDLERRLSILKKRVTRRGEDYAVDDEIDDIEDRLDELERRRKRRRREEEEEFRRQDRRDHRNRSRSRSNGPRRPPPGPPPASPRRIPPPRDDRHRRGPSSESDPDNRRRRSPSADSSGSSRSTYSSSASSHSSGESSDSRQRGDGERRGRSLSRSRSRSRSSSEDSRR